MLTPIFFCFVFFEVILFSKVFLRSTTNPADFACLDKATLTTTDALLTSGNLYFLEDY